jgi:hypothetical protein
MICTTDFDRSFRFLGVLFEEWPYDFQYRFLHSMCSVPQALSCPQHEQSAGIDKTPQRFVNEFEADASA